MSRKNNNLFSEESDWKRKQCLKDIRRECSEALQLNDESACFYSEELRIIEELYHWTDGKLEEMKCLEKSMTLTSKIESTI